MERKKPAAQEIYRHFKNQLYQIITLATHSETGEELVIYQALYGDFHVCARPLSMFMSEVDTEKYPEAGQRYRFEKVENLACETLKEQDKTILSEKKTEWKEAKPEEEIEEETEEMANPDLLAFLDADTMAEKKRVLIGMRQRITDRLINDMAASLDVMIEDAELEKRYEDLLYCVETKGKFEAERRR